MKKPKSSKRESESSERWDRLSELPNSLILHILSLLPMRDVVRTTLLSKRWKDLWTTIPCLHFHEDKSLRFQKFVNGALILWRGSKILKFGVDFYYKQSAYNDLDLWLRVALENEVEELHVNLLSHWDVSDGFIDTEYWAPQRLYSCISITKLSLVGCQLKIHGKVQWDRIMSLTIEDVCLSENVMNQVLSGSPQLEILILRLLESNENLNIRSSSLKTLKIEKYPDEKEDLVLTIWAPNVETFKIRGVLYDKYVLMDISSLTNATVCSECGDDDYDTVGYSCYKVVEDILEQVYRTNCRVDKVTLSHCGIKVLGEMKKKDMVAPLSNAKFLKLYATKVDGIVRLLEIFPC